MRISDWSSGVCSSDLVGEPQEAFAVTPEGGAGDGGDAGLVQQLDLQGLGGDAGAGDVGEGVEGAGRVDTGHAGQGVQRAVEEAPPHVEGRQARKSTRLNSSN